MIDRKQLLADLKPLLGAMETDLRVRCDEAPKINADLKEEYEQARAANRVGITFEEWRADLITQVAVAWVLSSVFVRFLEDNGLISPPRISGLVHGTESEKGLERARDERDLFFRSHPTLTDRDYLLSVFDDLAKLPGAREVFGPTILSMAIGTGCPAMQPRSSSNFFKRSTPTGPGRSSTILRMTNGTLDFWVTCTRTCPRPLARNTLFCRLRCSSKSSFLSVHWSRPFGSLA